MTKALISYFPVGTGDMTLVRLADSDETSLLIDINIRDAADDPNDPTRDVAGDLRSRLKRDAKGRPYVDGFLLSHPDKDHCTGLRKHFYLGRPEDYPDDAKKDAEKKIFIRQLWSSPLAFRRASKRHTLCEDAKAFNTEAKRRVQVNRDKQFVGVGDGDRILILGEDENGKTSDLRRILVRAGESFQGVNGQALNFLETMLLAPRLQENAEEEELLSKNHSSVIANLKIAANSTQSDGCRFLTGGDAEVAIWERLWRRYRTNVDPLRYDLLLTPHHCSWHTLSYDSWSKLREQAQVTPDARSALSQTRHGAIVVASSQPIVDDDNDPPCIRAKREYTAIADAARGSFYCTGEYPKTSAPEPLEFEVTAYGPAKLLGASATSVIASSRPPRAGRRA
jgi:hypothetical protein